MAAGSTYTPIQSYTLGSAQADVTFSSIASTYTDLVLVINTAVASSSGSIRAQLNGDTGAVYSATRLFGNGSTASSNRLSSDNYLAFGTISTTLGTTIVQVMNYANTTTAKTSLVRNNDSSSAVYAIVTMWKPATQAAISSIYIQNNAGSNFIAGSTFTLYGIAAA